MFEAAHESQRVMEEEKIGVIVNSNSNRGRNVGITRRFKQILRPGHDIVRVTDDISHAREVVEEFKEKGVTVYLPCGGDGTKQRFFSVMIPSYEQDGIPFPKIAVAHAGTKCLLASYVEKRRSPARTLEKVTEACRRRRPLPVMKSRPLAVTTDGSTEYGFMFATGFLNNFYDEYYKQAPGFWTDKKIIFRSVASHLGSKLGGKGKYIGRIMTRLRARVKSSRVDGERIDLPFEEYTAIVASPIAVNLVGFNAFYRGQKRDDFNAGQRGFHLRAGPITIDEIVRNLNKIRKGVELEVDSIYDGMSTSALVQLDEPTRYVLDGEIYLSGLDFQITEGPELEFVTFRALQK